MKKKEIKSINSVMRSTGIMLLFLAASTTSASQLRGALPSTTKAKPIEYTDEPDPAIYAAAQASAAAIAYGPHALLGGPPSAAQHGGVKPSALETPVNIQKDPAPEATSQLMSREDPPTENEPVVETPIVDDVNNPLNPPTTDDTSTDDTSTDDTSTDDTSIDNTSTDYAATDAPADTSDPTTVDDNSAENSEAAVTNDTTNSIEGSSDVSATDTSTGSTADSINSYY
jgi:hypothetical protein